MKIHNPKLLNNFGNNGKLNIAIVTDAYYPLIGGATVVVDSLAQALNKIANVVVIAPYTKHQDNAPYPVIRCKGIKISDASGCLGFPTLDFKFKKFLKTLPLDIVHCHTVFTLATYFKKLAKKRDIPFILHGHSKFNEEYKNIVPTKFIQRIMVNRVKRFANTCTEVWPVSEGCKQAYQKMEITTNFTVCRNATDLKYPSNASELINKTKTKYSLQDKKNILLFLSRLDSKTKNIPLLLKACKILKETGFEFFLILTGDGADRKTLENQCKSLNINKNVLFTGMVTNTEEKMGLYLTSNLFLFPSVIDTCGLVVLEASAMKTPSVLIKNSTPAEIATENFNCFLCEPTPECMAEKIKEALSNTQKLNEIASNAQAELGKNWEQTAQFCLTEYQRIIKTKGVYNDIQNK